MFTKKTFEDVFIRHFKELTGEDFRNLNIPIKIGTMHKTRGYFSYSVDEKCTPLAFKFSTILLDGRYKDEDVIKIIRHEIIHYIVLTKYGNVQDAHGKEFYQECLKHNVEFFEKSNFEYQHTNFVHLSCEKCGKVVKTFSTLKQAVKFVNVDNAKNIITSKCCKADCRIINREWYKNGS